MDRSTRFSIALLTVLLIAPVNSAFAQSEGPLFPRSVSNEGTGEAWADLILAQSSDDLSAVVATTNTPSRLVAEDFGFAIPAGVEIRGIEIQVERRKAALATDPASEFVVVRRGGVDLTLADGGGAILPGPAATDSVAIAGGEMALFGETWTSADINDAGFGVSYGLTGASGTYFVDAISVTVFYALPEDDGLCPAFGEILAHDQTFRNGILGGVPDIDGDGLGDQESLALMRAVACNDGAPASLKTASMTAFDLNLMTVDMEADAAALADFRELIAATMAISAATETELKSLLGMADPPFTLTGEYAQVTCSGETCMPQPVARRSLSTEFFDFDDPARAPNEPYSAEGDLDNDGTNNVTELMNTDAQGGSLSDFVIAATSPELDGTEPIRNPGGSSGSCFIATAAYGSPLAAELNTLRRMRDRVLLTHRAGAALVDVYYRVSPPLADWVARSEARAEAVRALLTPAMAAAQRPYGTRTLFAGFAAMCALATFQVRRRRTAHAR